ncbi:MAG: hypothetical protein E6I69_01580 [Chloroflexi bacterium]|nr:MAG: hypothetical protein E6I69_01580 [Chloroflexota bacterium]TME93531.1 MAG: hypothetical protein E6I34_05615 [Chloroflexota bacterium]
MRAWRQDTVTAAGIRSTGPRPLKRAIQRLVQDPLAIQLLEGTFAEGDTGCLTVSCRLSPEPAASG